MNLERLRILEENNVISTKVYNAMADIIFKLLLPKRLNLTNTDMFFTHLAMAMERNLKGNGIEQELDSFLKDEIIKNNNFESAKKLYKLMEDYFPCKLDNSEEEYIYMHLITLIENSNILVPGLTLAHEHTTIDLSSIKNDDDCNLNSKEETIKEFKKLYNSGIKNILDMTNIGIGRNIEYVEDVRENTGLNIVYGTGFYKEPFLPDYVATKNVDELSKIIVDELINGIDGTNIKAGFIGEIGSSKDIMTDLELKVFEASIKAAKETGAVISTHTTLGTYAMEQLDLFKKHNMDLDKIIIGHMDISGNLDIIIKLISEGINIGFDTIGKNNYFPDSKRVLFLKEIEKAGFIDKVVLSMDITRKSNMEYRGGIGYNYIIDKFIPMMKNEGLSDESIDKLLNSNIQRIFKWRI